MLFGLLSTAAPPLLMILRLLIVARTGYYRTQNIIVLGVDFPGFMWYHACMNDHTNDIETVMFLTSWTEGTSNEHDKSKDRTHCESNRF